MDRRVKPWSYSCSRTLSEPIKDLRTLAGDQATADAFRPNNSFKPRPLRGLVRPYIFTPPRPRCGPA